jgi:uncharacterized protein
MNREEAYQLMTEMIKNKNLQKHGLAVEAIMGALCDYLKKKNPELPEKEFNLEEWKIVGLLHDADYELIEKDPTRHTLVTEEKLREAGYDNERVINGIKAHHDGIKPSRDNLMERAVYCADELSGLITAVALVRPDKKLETVSVESVMKKFPNKDFAAGAKREQIQACEEELGIPLEEFVRIALEAMQGIHEELGL